MAGGGTEQDSKQLAKAFLHFQEQTASSEGSQIIRFAQAVLEGEPKTEAGSKGSTYVVQFNPTNLRFSTDGRHQKKKKDFQGKKGKISYKSCIQESIGGIRMSVGLVLDGYGERPEFVLEKAEGLIAASKGSYYGRSVSFCWETFCFTGYMEDISAEYTMFDKDGNPLRANIEFTVSMEDKKEIEKFLDTDYQSLFC